MALLAFHCYVGSIGTALEGEISDQLAGGREMSGNRSLRFLAKQHCPLVAELSATSEKKCHLYNLSVLGSVNVPRQNSITLSPGHLEARD